MAEQFQQKILFYGWRNNAEVSFAASNKKWKGLPKPCHRTFAGCHVTLPSSWYNLYSLPSVNNFRASFITFLDKKCCSWSWALSCLFSSSSSYRSITCATQTPFCHRKQDVVQNSPRKGHEEFHLSRYCIPWSTLLAALFLVTILVLSLSICGSYITERGNRVLLFPNMQGGECSFVWPVFSFSL